MLVHAKDSNNAVLVTTRKSRLGVRTGILAKWQEEQRKAFNIAGRGNRCSANSGNNKQDSPPTPYPLFFNSCNLLNLLPTLFIIASPSPLPFPFPFINLRTIFNLRHNNLLEVTNFIVYFNHFLYWFSI